MKVLLNGAGSGPVRAKSRCNEQARQFLTMVPRISPAPFTTV